MPDVKFTRDGEDYLYPPLRLRIYKEPEPNYPWVIAPEDENGGVVYAKTLDNVRRFIAALIPTEGPSHD